MCIRRDRRSRGLRGKKLNKEVPCSIAKKIVDSLYTDIYNFLGGGKENIHSPCPVSPTNTMIGIVQQSVRKQTNEPCKKYVNGPQVPF